MALALSVLGANAQSYNMFDAADVDADGWLWFDTQAKIDKYVSTANEDDNKLDLNGKVIQMLYADQAPDYPATTVDVNQAGVGTDGEPGGAGHKTGAIILQPASAIMTPNGGRFIVRMPSCTEYSICYSCENKVMARILDSKDDNADFDKYNVRNASYMGVFKRLPSGLQTWSGIEKLNNGTTTETIQSTTPINVMFQSGTKDVIYIHGIKVMTSTKPTGINHVTTSTKETMVYNLQGNVVNKASLSKGIYIVKQGNSTRKIVVK